MPLLKLWNSLIGRTAAAKEPDAKPVVAPTAADTPRPVAVSDADQLSKVPRSRGKKAAKPSKTKTTSGETVRLASLAAAETPVAAPVRQFKVVKRGEHAEICRLAIESGATSILEIGVGDGSRAEAVMQSLLAVSGEKVLKYAAIDQFEMVGGPVTLKDFHLRMRGLNVRPQVFPEPVPQGLGKFSRTIGFVDLVITSISHEQWNLAEVQSLVARITRPTSMVLHLSDGRWQRQTLGNSNQRSTNKAA